jgi:hypothetical protein
MERPQVRQIENQYVESEKEITGWEAEELLRKYGYSQNSSNVGNENQQPVNKPLTFEEMITQQDQKRLEDEQRRKQKMYGPKPTTFDGSRGYESEVKWGSDDELGFGFKIEITTDMNLPKY